MKASDRQEGGQHYKDFPIQPAEFCQRNRLNWCEANVVKYVCRHRDKKGAEDLRKAKHYIDLLLEWEYPEQPPLSDLYLYGNLCPSCQRKQPCTGDYPATADGGCEGYVQPPITIPPPSSLRERMLDAKEGAATVTAPQHPESCINAECKHHDLSCLRNCGKYPAVSVKYCGSYAPLDPFIATAKQDTPKTDEPTPAHTDPATNCKDCGNSFCVGVGRGLTCDQGCERFTPRGVL